MNRHQQSNIQPTDPAIIQPDTKPQTGYPQEQNPQVPEPARSRDALPGSGRLVVGNRAHKDRVKMGLSVTMGAVVATGFLDAKGARSLHIWAGVALVGLSLWHWLLYASNGRKRNLRGQESATA